MTTRHCHCLVIDETYNLVLLSTQLKGELLIRLNIIVSKNGEFVHSLSHQYQLAAETMRLAAFDCAVARSV
jgi:hypothetical protein